MDKRELARQIVDQAAVNPANKTSEDVGLDVARELQKTAPGDMELVRHAIDYMLELASTHHCGNYDADHHCALSHHKN